MICFAIEDIITVECDLKIYLALCYRWEGNGLLHIDQLTFEKNFRNFESVDIPLNSKMNIVIGNNGSGKVLCSWVH